MDMYTMHKPLPLNHVRTRTAKILLELNSLHVLYVSFRQHKITGTNKCT